MMDFGEALKDIKKDMLKDAKVKTPVKAKKPNPNRDEFKDIFKDEFDISKESVEAREKRLKDEFIEYTKNAKIKKI